MKKNSLKKNRRNVYKVDANKKSDNFINIFKADKEKNYEKENFFDKINLSFLYKYKKLFLSVISSFIIMFIIIYGGINLYSYITKSDNFLLTEIDISGESYLTNI